MATRDGSHWANQTCRHSGCRRRPEQRIRVELWTVVVLAKLSRGRSGRRPAKPIASILAAVGRWPPDKVGGSLRGQTIALKATGAASGHRCHRFGDIESYPNQILYVLAPFASDAVPTAASRSKFELGGRACSRDVTQFSQELKGESPQPHPARGRAEIECMWVDRGGAGRRPCHIQRSKLLIRKSFC